MKNATIHNVEQRSPEWFELRKGRLTGSEVGQWIVKHDKKSQATMHKMVCKKLAQSLDQPEAPIFESWAMKRGTEMEIEAVDCFVTDTNLDVAEVGFISSSKYQAGCSPDGLVSDLEGFEGKCPLPETHISYILNPKKLLEAYWWQVQLCLAITEADRWHLQSYCPGLPPVRHVIEASDATEEVKNGLAEFTEHYRLAENKLKQAFKEW